MEIKEKKPILLYIATQMKKAKQNRNGKHGIPIKKP